MQRELCAYLQDMIEAGQSIFEFTAGLSYGEFEANRLVRSAVERSFEIIGEALSQASAHYPGSVDSVPDLKDAIGQRHRLIHAYFEVDPKIVWETMRHDLQRFIEHIQQLRRANGC